MGEFKQERERVGWAIKEQESFCWIVAKINVAESEAIESKRVLVE